MLRSLTVRIVIMRFTRALKLLALCSLSLVSIDARAELTPQQAPRNAQQEIPFYLPISKAQFPELISQLEIALSDAGLSHLKLATTDYWHPYQNGIRQGRLGIYLAAPHFTSWLIHKYDFKPKLKLAGPLRYVIAARRADTNIFEVNDLANKTVCIDATMNLSFLLVKELMPNSVLSPKTIRVESVAEKMRLDDRRCDAFSLNEHLFLMLAADQPFKFISLKQSDEFSNYAYVVHPDVSQQTNAALTKLLTNNAVTKILRPMHQLLAAEPRIVRAKANHYPQLTMSPLQKYWGDD
jgi:hypothetical protein